MRLLMDLLWVIAGCVCAFAFLIAVRALARSYERRHMYELPLHERLGRFGHESCRERFWAKAGIDLLDRVTTQADLESTEHRVLDLPPWAWQHGPGCGVCRREARHAARGLARSENPVADEPVRLSPHHDLDPRSGDREFLGYLVQAEEGVCGNVLCPRCGYTIPKRPVPCVICDRPASFPTFFCEEHAWSDWQALVDRTVTVTYRVRGSPDAASCRLRGVVTL